MRVTEELDKKLKALATGGYGEFLVDYFEKMKDDVADVRTRINVRPEIANEVRLATVEQLDTFIVKIKKLAGTYEYPDDSWE